jgi:hypothetical protein
MENLVEYEYKENQNVHRDSRECEWEIVSRLHKNKYINFNEFEIFRCMYCDVMKNNWNSNLVDEDGFNYIMHFISQKL